MQQTTREIYIVDQSRKILQQVEETTQPLPACSVEITQNSKGGSQVSVKLYGTDATATAAEALALYRRLTQALESGQALGTESTTA